MRQHNNSLTRSSSLLMFTTGTDIQLAEDKSQSDVGGRCSEGAISEGTRRSYIYESEDISLEPGLVLRTKQEIELREQFVASSFLPWSL